MRRYTSRYIILLLDFDNQSDRADRVKAKIPNDLSDRVFLLGAKSEPEALKQAGLGSYETIGKILAKECRDGTPDLWSYDLLHHNANEIDRLKSVVSGILFL